MRRVAGDPIAMWTLRMATRLRLRGRPWSTIANAIAAVAAGTLGPEQLRRSVASAWDVHDPADPNDFTLMAWERHLIDQVVPAKARLLVVGSGRGRDVVAYARLGFHVTGVEPAPAAADACASALRQEQLPGAVIHGFVEDVAIDTVVDVVIFSYYCYGYLPRAARRVAALAKLRRNIAAGGVLVITYNPRGLRTLSSLMKLGASISRPSSPPEDGDRVYLTGRPNAPFAIEHLFDHQEIAGEVERAGYRVTFQATVGEVCLLVAKPIDAAS